MLRLHSGIYLPKTGKIPGMTAVSTVYDRGQLGSEMALCTVIKMKWQLQVKLRRKLLDEVTDIKVIHIFGCGCRMTYSQ